MGALSSDSGGDLHRSGAGTPMVLLHGVNLSWRIWRPVIPFLESHHDVLAPTLAGHLGGPRLTSPVQGVGPLADAIETMLDDLGIDRAHLVGNSLGGWLACELAERGRALSVVAFSPAGAWDSLRSMRRILRLMQLSKNSAGWPATRRLVARPGVRRSLMKMAFERGDLIPADVAIDMLDETQACVVLDGLIPWLRANPFLDEFRLEPSVPVRVAWPVTDRTIPYLPYGRAFRALLPGAELVGLRGVGHVPTYDDPRLVADTILEVSSRRTPVRTSNNPPRGDA
jgi:pimeloyl-ACP methyl ester carboxylesterase